jgi:hypothetical protein
MPSKEINLVDIDSCDELYDINDISNQENILEYNVDIINDIKINIIELYYKIYK